MCAPFFRASQLKQSSPSLPNAPLVIDPALFDDGSRYDFHHLATETGEPYDPYTPSVCCVVRMVAVFCPYVLDEHGEPSDILRPTYFEPSWFSCHIFWEWFFQVDIDDGLYQRAIVDASRERIIEYLLTHEEPFPTEEYNALILEIY